MKGCGEEEAQVQVGRVSESPNPQNRIVSDTGKAPTQPARESMAWDHKDTRQSKVEIEQSRPSSPPPPPPLPYHTSLLLHPPSPNELTLSQS